MTSTTAVVTPTTLAKEQVLKEGYIVDEKDRPKVGYKDFSDDIPVISLAGVLEDGCRREEIVKEIAAASEEWGIFQVLDHGVDTQLISQMTELAKEFFALPDEEKLRFQASPGKKGGFIISSHLQNQVVANWREFVLFFTYPIHDRDYSRWPDKPEEWRAATEVYSQRLMNLSLLMLELVSEGLGLEKDALKNSMGEIGQRLVVNHYPKCPKPDLALGLIRHTDPSSITVLFQDDVGGLQATKDDGNTWVTVRPIKNSLVVNLGDHVYHMSNGRFKSADHKAVVNSNKTRMSIAVFTNAHEQATVYPLGIGPGDKSVLEEPITYAELRRRHDIRYIEVPRLKKLAKEENWSQEELELKLSQLK